MAGRRVDDIAATLALFRKMDALSRWAVAAYAAKLSIEQPSGAQAPSVREKDPEAS